MGLASLWALVALVAGAALSLVVIDPGSALAPLAFQGIAGDAGALLTTIASTVVTVIAVVLGLTVVALQLSLTQFSPRLLRSFLRDRATQRVLSVYLATFTYSAAGLYTVGVSPHSIQIDAITTEVQRSTLAVVQIKPGTVEDPTPQAPAWAVAVASTRSGYIRAA